MARYPTADEYDPKYAAPTADGPDVDEMLDQMGMDVGTVWMQIHPCDDAVGEPFRIEAEHYDEVRVTDPTEHHPQSARAGRWRVNVDLLYRTWRRGLLVPADVSYDPAWPEGEMAPEMVEQVSEVVNGGGTA